MVPVRFSLGPEQWAMGPPDQVLPEPKSSRQSFPKGQFLEEMEILTMGRSIPIEVGDS